MYNNLLTIGKLTIHSYGLMIAIGILAAYFTAEYRAKKQGLDYDKVFGLVIWCVIFGFLGSKILYFITIFDQIIKDPSIMIRSLADGWVVYGGIIGGIIGGFLYCKRNKLPSLRFFDIGLASVALAQGFGRIGCFLAGCCYGVETDSVFSITFTHSDFAPNNVSIVPTQLISSVLDFLLAFFLIIISKRKKYKPGQCTGLYLICYGVGRFILEFFRGDLIRGSVGFLSTSQFISIFIVIAGIIFFYICTKREIKEEKLKACIFDLDGTLLYTLDSIAAPTNAALKEYGFEEQPLEAYKQFVGDGYRNCVKRALIAAGDVDLLKEEEVYTFGKHLYDENPMYEVEPFDGMKEALLKLKQNKIKLAVLTNKPHESAITVVEHFFGKGTFDFIRGQIDGKPFKPDPVCANDILEKFNVKPEECAYFGDSNTDMQMGKNAGFYTVGVLWGYRSREELEENHADTIIKDINLIPEVCSWVNIQKNV